MKKNKPKPIAVVIADTHLDDTNVPLIEKIYEQTIEHTVNLGFPCFFNVGDVFHSRKHISQYLLEALDRILSKIEKAGLIMWTIPGNHDKTDYDSIYSFLSPFRYHPALKLITDVSAPISVGNGIGIHMLPFFNEKGLYMEKLAQLVAEDMYFISSEKNILLTHVGINKAKLPNGRTHEGLIGPELFRKFDAVYVGHFHDPTTVGDTIMYIGAAWQQNYGENRYKGPVVIYDDLTPVTIDVSFPEYIKYDINIKDLKDPEIITNLTKLVEEGHNVRINLIGTEAELKSIDFSSLQALGIDIKFKAESTTEDMSETSVEFQHFTADKIVNEFEAFCSKDGLDIETGKEYLKAINIV